MSDAAPPPAGFTAELRAQALARLAREDATRGPPDAAPPSDAERERTLHELRVHQIELELQNDELRRAQLDLEASRQRWFELYDLAPVGYLTVSEGGLILQANLAAAELLGQPRAALARRRLSEFIEPEDRPRYFALHLTRLDHAQPLSCELRLQDGATTQRWMQLTATATTPDALSERQWRVVLQDITDRRQAQAAQAALAAAEQAHRSRSEFLSRVSHEFRTPLNAIIGFSHLLLHNDELALPDKARQQLQHVHDAGQHLVQMVTDLLDISRAAAGRLALRIDDVDALAVLGDAIRDVSAQALAAGVTITLDTLGVSKAGVRADPTRLRQVFQNLLSNAVKFNRPGGQVAVRLERPGPQWQVHIIDTGMGMTPSQQAALFQPFNRLGRESTSIEGTGLGLVIARDLVQEMGGQLTMHSEPGRGSEFTVALVASKGDPDLMQRARAAATPASSPEAIGRVLCVEDDPASRELIQHILERRPDIALEIVGTGAAAIAAARRDWPRLLLLDLRLPDMPGLNVLKVLRQLNPHLPLRCLVISVEWAPEDVERSHAAGADGHLAKPVDSVALLSLVDRLLTKVPPP
ncbi:response regulator [Ideonella sp. 4Y16]|uniref:histidine kinase n=1 Tax=Ideonella alba TaxID=2824118 RepID=A0A941BJC5_9BURK|nr:ATP-binding protein [Ideonella alba]MBQ0928939.1 response regulator [Ideonella alba]MBQ0942874.1 response regulator [Ideonella alba]